MKQKQSHLPSSGQALVSVPATTGFSIAKDDIAPSAASCNCKVSDSLASDK
jgi:hypothetical protein